MHDFLIQGNSVLVATQFGIYEFTWKKPVREIPVFTVNTPEGNYLLKDKQPKIVFDYSNSWVKIPFEVVELGESHPFVLQYRLIRNENYSDSSWTNSSVLLNELSFEHLEGGRYRLEMRLKDPYSQTYSDVKVQTFEVKYFWLDYKWIWFVFGVFSTLVISAYIRNRELKFRGKRLKS